MLILFTGFALQYGIASAQCPAPGLRIQSASCDSPRNLSVTAVSCTSLQVQWLGSADQTYSVMATGTDPITGQVYQSLAAKSGCDGSGHCTATIPVKAGSDPSWSVQGTCSAGGNTLSGYTAFGAPVSVPVCQTLANALSNPTGMATLKVYPNPTTGILTVDYDGSLSGDARLSILDISGKRVMTLSPNALSRTGDGYELDFRGLLSGTYLLLLSNGKEEKRARFVLVRD